jgi:ATP-dependent Clp protease ATP-binding subunit ClpX
VHCSFCGRSNSEVGVMVTGPEGAYICASCAERCRELFEARQKAERAGQ